MKARGRSAPGDSKSTTTTGSSTSPAGEIRLAVPQDGRHIEPLVIQPGQARPVRPAAVLDQDLGQRVAHSFATGLLRKGVDIRLISQALGHASLDTTMVYTEVANDLLASAIGKLTWDV